MIEIPAVPMLALVKRELLTTLRKARVFWILLAFVVVLSLTVLANWPRNPQFTQMAWQLRQMLMMLSAFFLLMAGAICVPPLGAASIVSEKEQDTFDLLSLTLIRPSGILIGKLSSILGFFMLILIGTLPVFCAVFFAVGVDWIQMLKVFSLVVATAAAGALLSIACSAWMRRTSAALLASYLVVVLAMGGGVLLGVLLLGGVFHVRSYGNLMERSLMIVCPIGTVASVFGMSGGKSTFLEGFMYQILLCAVGWIAAVHALRRRAALIKVPSSKIIDDPALLAQRRTRFPFYVIDPLRRKKTIEDGRNPMMVRELRWGIMGKSDVMIRVFYIAFVAYLFLGMGAVFAWGGFESVATWIGTQIIVTIVGAPLLTANSFTKEHELGNIDMLRMTLLQPSEIIMGKTYAGMASLTPLLFAAVLSCVPFFLFMLDQWAILISGYITLFTCSYLSLAVGFLASVLTKRSSASVILSYVFGLFVFLGNYATVAVLTVLIEIAGGNARLMNPDSEGFVAFFSPVSSLFYGWEHESHLGGFAFLTYWAFSQTLFTLLASGIFRVCVRILERRMQDE